MRVRITIEGESNATDEHDLAQLRGLLADQMPRLELSSSGFGVGLRDVGLVDVAEDPVSDTGAQQHEHSRDAEGQYDEDPGHVRDELGQYTDQHSSSDLALDALTVPELVAMAQEREVDVTRSDGRTDLSPKKADYVAALS